MGSHHIACKIAIGFLLFQSFAAYADPAPPLAPLVMEGKYFVAWNGLVMGRINLSAHEDAQNYTLTVDTKTHGVGILFKTERRIAEANGAVTPQGYIAHHFESRPQGKDEGQRSTIEFDAAGKIATREQVPQDDRNWRPEVSLADANTANDPVTAGLVLRRKLYEALAQGKNEVAIRTYDGSRLAEMKFAALADHARVTMPGDGYGDAINTIVTREPIAGYTPKEIKKYNAGDPIIHLYFSADAKFVPVRATVSLPIGELSVSLEEMKTPQ